MAQTFTVPHVLDVSGTTHTAPATFAPFDTGGFTHTMQINSIGPGENGEFIRIYSAPIVISGSDALSRSFTFSFEVIFAQTRPEGTGYRSEYFLLPTWTEFNGQPVNVGTTSSWELSVFGFEPQPLGGAGMIFATPASHFEFEDGTGRRHSVDMSAGELRIGAVPAPWTAALLSVAGLLGLRKRRD